MKGRIQLPIYTAAALEAANPLLLSGEIVYESDTGRHKIGNGVRRWKALGYSFDANDIPALAWKVEGGALYVRPATDINNPILKRCYVGFLHYKHARCRKHINLETDQEEGRHNNAGYKVVDDNYARDELSWTGIRIVPIPYGEIIRSEWKHVLSVQSIFSRWVTKERDAGYVNDIKYILHRGRNKGKFTFGRTSSGKVMQKVTFYGGVLLYVLDNKNRRIEGPRTYFKIEASNYGPGNVILKHI